MRRLSITVFTLVMAHAHGAPVWGAGHHEINVIPLGPTKIKQGVQDVVYRLPSGPRGVLSQPVVLIASQPWAPLVGPGAPVVASSEDAEEQDKQLQQVPATVRISIGSQALPDWKLAPHRTAYVINLETLRKNKEYASGNLALKIELVGEAEGLTLHVAGMPDPLLLNEGRPNSPNGPLELFEAQATDPEVKAYFSALGKDIAGEHEAAKVAYEKLESAKNQRVARFARRGLRALAYQLRKRKLSGNFMEHYRWGLYLQFCGFFDFAFDEFEECRIILADRSDAQFRAGECLDRMGASLMRYVHYMDRTGETAKVGKPKYWYTLVTILKKRGNKTLSQVEIEQIKVMWVHMERIFWAATGGTLRIATSFYEIENEKEQAYAVYDRRVHGPAEDIIETRGWFDSLVSIRPRLAGEKAEEVAVAGADVGPNGVAIASVYHDAGWQGFLKAIYGHLRWAAEASESEPGLPAPNDAIDCGQQPTPHEGAAYRSALRYHFTTDALKRLNIAELPVEGSYLQLWKIEGPFRVNDKPPSSGPPARHVLDPIPAGTPERTQHVVSETDFIDLARWMPDAGWARARATTWVYVPEAQDVQIRLGRNDGMAAYLNGRCFREGRYYSAGEFEDMNLVDTIFTVDRLEEGWNEIRVIVESWPGKWNKGWGFSVSITTTGGKAIRGLASVHRLPRQGLVQAYQPPTAGNYYSWSKVRHDYRRLLPRLSDRDLQVITGVKGLAIVSQAKPMEGFVAIMAPNRSASATYRPLPASWQADRDRDVVLNNLMDWDREACAAFRHRSGGHDRDLVILKPEAIEAFLTLLDEPRGPVAVFRGLRPDDRILGYVEVRVGSSTRTLLVLHAQLGDERGWPVDEEGLLTPFGEYMPNKPEDAVELGPPLPPTKETIATTPSN